MADFRAAFQTGLKANDHAEQNRKEIDDVLREFDDQIRQASNGAIQIKHEKRTKLKKLPRPQLGMLPAVLEPRDEIHYDALVATNDRSEKHELCELEFATYGYPVGLRYADVSARCHDRASLESGLVKLLEHPDTGGTLQRLLASAGTGEPRK